MLCRASKPATMRKRTVRTAGQSITPTRTMANIPPGDSLKTTRPMGIRPMANLPQNPHPNQRPKVRQLLYQIPKSLRKRPSIGSMGSTTQTRMKPRKPPAKRSSANRPPRARQSASTWRTQPTGEISYVYDSMEYMRLSNQFTKSKRTGRSPCLMRNCSRWS